MKLSKIISIASPIIIWFIMFGMLMTEQGRVQECTVTTLKWKTIFYALFLFAAILATAFWAGQEYEEQKNK